MRLLSIDPDPRRAALLAEGLAGMQPLELRHQTALAEHDLRAFAPDLVVVACDCADRDMISGLHAAMQASPCPIVMFVNRSEPGLAEQAVRAGVAAYVVDGLHPSRVRPILEAAMTRFQLVQKLRADLAKAQADLAGRKAIERAKSMLMRERQIEEDAAYAILRKLAMDTGRPLAAAAADLLLFAGALKGDKT